MEFEVGDKIIWNKVNSDKTTTATRTNNMVRTIVTNPFEAVIIDITSKRYLLEVGPRKVRKWIVKRHARFEKITKTG